MFCVNREHAKEQMGAFIDSGIPFGYIDANTSIPDRKRLGLAFSAERLFSITTVRATDAARGLIFLEAFMEWENNRRGRRRLSKVIVA